MEKKEKKIVVSTHFRRSFNQALAYGFETFGDNLVDSFFFEVNSLVNRLNIDYRQHPECRHLPTASKKYRHIIIGSYLILYRVKVNAVEVLVIYHASISPKKVKAYRKIKV